MSFLTSKTFWVDAVERAVKTFAQASVAVLSVDTFGLLDVNYIQWLSVAGLSSVISLLTSIASGSAGKTDSASLVVETKEIK